MLPGQAHAETIPHSSYFNFLQIYGKSNVSKIVKQSKKHPSSTDFRYLWVDSDQEMPSAIDTNPDLSSFENISKTHDSLSFFIFLKTRKSPLNGTFTRLLFLFILIAHDWSQF